MIKIQVIGNLGCNAVLKDNGNFKPFTTFPVGVNEKYRNSEGIAVDRTVWIQCNINWDCSNLRPYLTKGSKVYVCGSMRTRVFTTNNGINCCGIDCFVDTIELCGSPRIEGDEKVDMHENDKDSNLPFD